MAGYSGHWSNGRYSGPNAAGVAAAIAGGGRTEVNLETGALEAVPIDAGLRAFRQQQNDISPSTFTADAVPGEFRNASGLASLNARADRQLAQFANYLAKRAPAGTSRQAIWEAAADMRESGRRPSWAPRAAWAQAIAKRRREEQRQEFLRQAAFERRGGQ